MQISLTLRPLGGVHFDPPPNVFRSRSFNIPVIAFNFFIAVELFVSEIFVKKILGNFYVWTREKYATALREKRHLVFLAILGGFWATKFFLGVVEPPNFYGRLLSYRPTLCNNKILSEPLLKNLILGLSSLRSENP